MADDPVVAALSEVAAIMFPAVYGPDVQVGQQSLPNPEAIRQLYADEDADPAYARAVDVISRDPVLAPLLADGVHRAGEEPRGLIPGAFIRTDTGNAWLIQSNTHLPGTFVHTAARYVLARGLPTDSIAPLLDELARVVARVRRLMAGEPDDAAVLMAFHGLRISEGVTLETPWGSLRAASSFERGQRLFGGPSPSAILETTVPVRWTLAERQVRISDELATIATHPDLLALTVLLALGQGTPLQWLWRATLVPLQILTNGYVGRAISAPWAEPPARGPLTEEQADALVIWAKRVAHSYHPSVAVAMRRTLSAVSERRFSAEDALIDAVIAWENLFGTGGKSEMTFRITTALTILLEPEPSARLELHSELREVSELRSTVAHGGEVKPNDHLAEKKDRAIDVAVKALQALFERRPLLLRDPERGTHLILGLPETDGGPRLDEPQVLRTPRDP